MNEIEAANTQIPAWAINNAQTALGVGDAGLVIITGILYLVSMILAFRIRTSPIFFIPSMIFNVLALLIAAEISNAFWKLVNVGGAFSTAADSFPILVEVMKNLPVIVGALNFLLIIFLYISPSRNVEVRA